MMQCSGSLQSTRRWRELRHRKHSPLKRLKKASRPPRPLMAEHRPDRRDAARAAWSEGDLSALRSFRDLTAVHPSPSPEEEGLGEGEGTTTMDLSRGGSKSGTPARTAGEDGAAALEHSPRSRIRGWSAGCRAGAGQGGWESGTTDGPEDLAGSGMDAGVPHPELQREGEHEEREVRAGEGERMAPGEVAPLLERATMVAGGRRDRSGQRRGGAEGWSRGQSNTSNSFSSCFYT